ncbi:MAG: tetratricopeptide repeat protein, partial [Nitrospinae bacterium]|nr:tetratricopeptide repeat protein [Nitrospinota bacterium]
MFGFLKSVSRQRLEMIVTALVVALAAAGAGIVTLFLFNQTKAATITIKGGRLPADTDRKPPAAGNEGATEASDAGPDPAVAKSPGQRQAETAGEAAARGDHRAALTFYRAALAEEPDNLAYLKGAGEAALKSGDYEQAEGHLRKAVSRNRADGGTEGDDTAAALANNLSRTLLAKGDAAEAEEVIARSVAAQRREGGRYGESLATLAEAAYAGGRWEVAAKAAREGQELFRKEGPLNPHYVALLRLSARMAAEEEDFIAAESALKEELVVAERQGGRDSEGVARVLIRYALLSYRMEKYGPSHEKLTEALAIARRVYPAGSELESETLRTLALVEETLYPGQVAERRLREARSLDLKIHGPRHRRSAESAVSLARYLAGAGQYQEA